MFFYIIQNNHIFFYIYLDNSLITVSTMNFNNIFSVCVLLLVFSACTEDEVASRLTYPEGKLKKVLTYGIVHNNSVAEKPYHRSEFFYNSDELLVKEENYFEDDHHYRYFEYTYDEAERLVMKSQNTIIPYKESYRTIGFFTYEYDNTGRLISQSYILNKDGSSRNTVNFLYFGDTLKIGQGQSDSLVHIYRDDRLSEEKYFEFAGEMIELMLKYWYTYEYDKEGKLLNKKWINGITNHPEGVEEGIEEEYFYNEWGQLIESRHYNPHWHFAYVDKKVYEYY